VTPPGIDNCYMSYGRRRCACASGDDYGLRGTTEGEMMMTNFYTLEREWRMRDMAHSRVMAWLRQISCLFGGQSQRPKVLKGITFGGKNTLAKFRREEFGGNSCSDLLQNRNRFIFLTWFGRFLTSPNSSLGKIFDIAGRFLTSSKEF